MSSNPDHIKNEPLVSVIIPTYNRVNILCNCVTSVLHSNYTHIECIVADNASTDNTIERLNELFSNDERFILVRLSRNLMAAGGRNAGILASSGKIIIFLDSDNIVESDMIQELVFFYQTHPDAGVVAPISADAISHNKLIVSSVHNLYTSKTIRTELPYEYLKTNKLRAEYKSLLSQNCFAVSRQALDMVGGMDPIYGIMYEESDFAYRVAMVGFNNYTASLAITNHMQDVIFGDNAKLRKLGCGNPERTFAFARNRCIFEKKFANSLQKTVFFVIFVHVFVCYYCFQAIKSNRFDIALGYIRGTLKGYITKPEKKVNINIKEYTTPYIIV